MKKDIKNKRFSFSPVLIFGLAVGLQVLILLFIPMAQWLALLQGRTVFLETETVDPYSIISGYYVELNCAIADPLNLPYGDIEFSDSQNYYIVIAPDNEGIWQPRRVLTKLPSKLKADEVVIRGSYNVADRRLEYGLENYYLPETKRNLLEDILREQLVTPDMIVEAKVDRQGRAAIVKIIVGGKEFAY